jgi:hypothetical protein
MSDSIVRELLRKHSAGRMTMRANTLNSRLHGSGIDEFTIRSGLKKLAEAGEIAGAFDAYGFPLPSTSLRLALKAKPRGARAVQFEVTMQSLVGLSELERTGLSGAAELLHDLSSEDLQSIVDGLRMLAASEIDVCEPVFVVSARYLLGSSKILDCLPAVTLKAFGIQRNAMPRLSPNVVIGGPSEPDAVVLVENPHSFEAAVKSNAVNRVAFVCVHGYGLSLGGDAWGEQLATVLEQRQYVSLTRCGNPPPLEVLLRHRQLYFWGDLDMASIDIFERIRRQFKQIQLSRLYRPLIEFLRVPGKNHPYAIVAGKDGQQIPETQHYVAAGLLQLCTYRAVDQESLHIEDIERYAFEMLDMDDLHLANY